MRRKTYTSSEVKSRYNRKHYDQITFRCGKGGLQAVKALADSTGMSLAAYLRHLIIADAEKHGNHDISAILGGEDITEFLKSIIRC